MSIYKITCIFKEKPNVLFPLLLPMNFKWTENESITWSSENIEFKIVPFSFVGRESMGYRIHFKGSPETCVYLMDQFLSRFNPRISGIECVHESTKQQRELIQIAERKQLRRGSLYGIYEYKEVGIVLLPTNDIHLQVRNHEMKIRSLAKYLKNMETAASYFMTKPYDLFSFEEEANAS